METTFPFGKHKGKPLSEIPDDYFAWLRREGVDLNPWLEEAVQEEIERRAKERRRGQSSFDEDEYYENGKRTRSNGDGSYSYTWSRGNFYYSNSTSGNGSSYSPPGRIPAIVDRETALEIVEAGRRALARKHHPDTGGSNELMAKINSISDWLEEYLKSVLPTNNNQHTGRR
jgi:hypothetical protein